MPLIALLAAVLAGPGGTDRALPCEDPGAHPWIVDFRDRVLSFNDLHRLAVAQLGEPISCDGEITTEFDGVFYGRLVIGYSNDASLVVETMPIETSIVELRVPAGFDDPETARAALADYTQGIGLEIDWEAAETTTEGPETVHTHWDPETGLNASASLVFVGDRLVGIRVSMAL